MARYLLCHGHQPRECGIVFASFKGSQSPLRHQAALASCDTGGHEIWWTVQAETEADAVGVLPADPMTGRKGGFSEFHDHDATRGGGNHGPHLYTHQE